MKLTIQINVLIEKLNEFQIEFENLKNQINLLENKNKQLSSYLKKDKKSQSIGNLFKLYEQGFHICNESFGQIREEDCLFCLNTINRIEDNNE